MSNPNCPFCGAKDIYKCGSWGIDAQETRNPLCREREAHNKTKRERDELLKEHSTLRDIAERAVKNIREARNLSVIGDWREIDIIQERLRSELDQLK